MWSTPGLYFRSQIVCSVYINDICNISSVLNFILFADNTNIFCSGKDLDSLYRTVSSELNKLSDWFAVNKLSLNIAKTSFMIFSKRSISENLETSINDFKLERIYVTKFLGVLIDSSAATRSAEPLDYHPHVIDASADIKIVQNLQSK